MSKVQLSGNASGTGIFTIASPNSNTDRTLTLPDATGTVALQGGAGVGKVLQVVGATTAVGVSTSGTSYVASNVTATITPTSATSKIFILATFWQNSNSATCTCATTIYRNSTDLAAAQSLGMGSQYLAAGGGETNGALSFLDSPATTSATTYTVYFKRADSAGTVAVANNVRLSSITLMEIAA